MGATAFRFIMSKALSSTETSSDYVEYAEMAALPERKIVFYYVIRNTMLPQVTDLGLSLGAIFEGALITEVVFGYPGVGYALYNAINSADYNVIMGITLLSIVGIATASLLVDLSYPLFDPRVRFRYRENLDHYRKRFISFQPFVSLRCDHPCGVVLCWCCHSFRLTRPMTAGQCRATNPLQPIIFSVQPPRARMFSGC